MDAEAVRKFNAASVGRSIESDREIFTRDSAYMASLAANIANSAQGERPASADLMNLSQRVAALVALAAKIDTATELHGVMSAGLAKTVGEE